jgi:hypothetical protein
MWASNEGERREGRVIVFWEVKPSFRSKSAKGNLSKNKSEADGEALYSSASSPQVCFQVLMPRIYNYFNAHDINRLDIYPHWNVEDSAFRYEDTINKVALRRLSESHRDRWKNAKTFLTDNKIK